jgi:regulator of sirC expression with transglutaminase-like and TPR domain
VVLMALGRRVGILVEGVGFPGHFLVRIGGPDGDLVDPFSEGNVVERSELSQIAGRLLDERALATVLEPVDLRVIAVRMLFNLQHIHERRGDHAQALLVCDRLVDLAAAPFHRRDRGLHALALGATSAAIADFEAYLETHPDADDRDRIVTLLEGARARDAAPAN